MDFSNFNSAEQAHMTKIIEKKQVNTSFLVCSSCKTLTCEKNFHKMQDFLRMYANLAEKCFNTCCNDFTSKALTSKEASFWELFSLRKCYFWPEFQETCIMNCTEKFIKHSERVGARFAEYNAGKFLRFCSSSSFRPHPRSTEVMNNAQNQSWANTPFAPEFTAVSIRPVIALQPGFSYPMEQLHIQLWRPLYRPP